MSLIINGRGERIRTSDPLVPNQVRYQTALRPDVCCLLLAVDAGCDARSRESVGAVWCGLTRI